jgi:hypothetical protein
VTEIKSLKKHNGFEMFTAVTMKGCIFWVAMPRDSEAGPAERELNSPPASDNLLRGVLFDLEDRGGVFLRNVEVSPNYTALQPRRP